MSQNTHHSKKKYSPGERLAYRFDNFMAAGARSIFMALLVLFLGAFVITSAARIIVSGTAPTADFKEKKRPNPADDLWNNFMQIIDPGAIAEDNDSPWHIKLVGLASIFFGLIFFSAVIAFITTQLDIKIENLKKGRSHVIESGHTLILGWSDQVIEIIKELVIANESEKHASIVVMSDLPKEEMDDYFNIHLPNKERKSTRIITRSGVVSSLESLERVSVTESKAVIILPGVNESGSEEEKVISDAKTLKTLLAVVAASKEDETRTNIITEVFDKNNRDLMISLAPDNITMVNTEEIIAKMIVQTSRSSGLGVVYSNLIGFDGCEFYYYAANWNGLLFGEIPFHFEDGIPIGLRDKSGNLQMHPPANRPMENGEEIVIIAEDDSSISFNKTPLYAPGEFAPGVERLKKNQEKELIIGWNSRGKIIIEEYCEYILNDSVIDIVLPEGSSREIHEISEIKERKHTHQINVHHMNPIGDISEINPESYNNVIILNKVEDDLEKVDSTTITILLRLRALFRQTREKTGHEVKTQLISEVMDSENLELISRTGVNDFIISNQMVSKVFAQTAENPDILKVYEDLFKEEGSEIYLKPMRLYFKDLPKAQVQVADLIKVAQNRGEIFIGYRLKKLENNIEENFGVIVNPEKNRRLSLEPEDTMVVLAEDEL